MVEGPVRVVADFFFCGGCFFFFVCDGFFFDVDFVVFLLHIFSL